MSNEMNETKEKEISFSALLQVLRKNIVIILIVTILFGVVGGLYSVLFQETKYVAKAEFYVKNILGTSDYITDGMLTAGAKIASSCVEAAEKDLLAKKAVRAHGLDKKFECPESNAVKYVKSMINASKTSVDSQAFSVTVTSSNPEHTYWVILAVQEIMDDVVKEITTASEDAISASDLALYEWVETEKDISTVKPSMTKMAVIGAALGFVISYVICFIIYVNDTKVYDEESIKTSFNYPLLGSIPQWILESDTESLKLSRKKMLLRDLSKTTRKYNNKLISPDTPFAITESFKQLRTNLCYSIAAEKCPVFAITSDFSGAGKSLISANLAISFAQLGKKTLLVEGDLRCPDFKHIFKKANSVGLSELLSGNLGDYKEALTDEGYDNMSVIFSGRIPPNPSELLGSDRMKELVDLWTAEYDVVIIDLPPVFEVADAGVMSTLISGYVIVARSDHSDTTALAGAVDNLRRVHGNICGFVINDINMKVGSINAAHKYGKYNKYAKYRKYSVYANNKK
ncbi:MAG: polysaccharide biosynthesis tyrosine autokinase [Clostridia bacterium]|nr:polysaccharide biosynthesis tyrosine autokinase [Clostridia bacterium]